MGTDVLTLYIFIRLVIVDEFIFLKRRKCDLWAEQK